MTLQICKAEHLSFGIRITCAKAAFRFFSRWLADLAEQYMMQHSSSIRKPIRADTRMATRGTPNCIPKSMPQSISDGAQW